MFKHVAWLGALALVSPTAFAANTHCTPQEKVIFSCSTGKKTVSVCAAKTLTPQEGYAQYRFGPLGAPELVYPAVPTHPRSTMKGGTLMYSGGGGAYLRVTHGAYAYVLYTGIGKGWKKDGVAVEKDGRLTANLACKGRVVSELGPALFSDAGIPEYDSEAFDMP